jgi:hypothetical protein
MQSNAVTYFALVFLAGFASCSTFEPDFTSHQFDVGQVTSVQASEFLGMPDRIDTVSGQGTLVFLHMYRFANSQPKPPEPYRGVSQVPQKNLVLEFVNDTLHGYIYNNSMEHPFTSFDQRLRGKILIGHANKSVVRDLLGEPAGKIMLPTLLFGHPLLKNIAHIIPQNAHELWCYYYDYFYFRAGTKRRLEYYKFFAVYFDSAGVVNDKFYSESDKIEPRITRIFTN